MLSMKKYQKDVKKYTNESYLINVERKFKMSGDDSIKCITDPCSWKDIEELFEELELFGVPSLPEIKQDQLCFNDAMTLLKCLANASYHMLYRHRKFLREFEELEMKRMREMDDNLALKVTVEHLKRDFIEKDRALIKKEEECKKVKETLSKTQQEFKVQTEAIRQLRCQLKYNEKKNIHDIRRKEQEISKLQGQFDQISVSQPQRKLRQIHPTKEAYKATRDKGETYEQIICKFESNNKDLMLENEIISKAFRKLNNDLALLVADFDNLMLFLPHGKENESVEAVDTEVKEEDEVMESTRVLSLEECIMSSNNHVDSLNTRIDNLKQKYL